MEWGGLEAIYRELHVHAPKIFQFGETLGAPIPVI
jgi:hypothetical protein